MTATMTTAERLVQIDERIATFEAHVVALRALHGEAHATGGYVVGWEHGLFLCGADNTVGGVLSANVYFHGDTHPTATNGNGEPTKVITRVVAVAHARREAEKVVDFLYDCRAKVAREMEPT